MTAAACTCGTSTTLHSVECLTVAVTQPHAMVNVQGDVFYPDSREDAEDFYNEYGARYLNEVGPSWQ